MNELTKQARIKPGTPEIWLSRAEHLAKGSEFAAAVQDYSRVLSLQPGRVAALQGRAESLMHAGKYQDAIVDCDSIMMLQPSATAYSLRGDLWYAVADFDNAINDFEAADRMDGIVAEAYRARAKQLKADGKNAEAEADLKKAAHVEAALAGELTPVATNSLPEFPESNEEQSDEE